MSVQYWKKTTMSKEPLIIGIDPGNTSAIAALDLDGELVLLESRLEFAPEDIIQRAIDVGKPVVVSCDKQKMPSTVEKIASSLGAEKFEPEKDLSRQRKRELGGKGENSHEKDAYASAMHALKDMRKQVRKINEKSRNEEVERHEIAGEYLAS